MEEVVTMSRREVERHHVVRSVLEGQLRQAQAATMLRIGIRQVKRLCAKVRARGATGVVHGLRGRPSNRQLDLSALEKAACALHDPLWQGFRPTFAQQKLEALHGITLSDETVRQLMTQLELWQPRRARARHRAWRERRPMLGMMVQLDGSTHDWFEGRRRPCVLLVYIDDATSRILHAEFVEVEDTLTLMRVTRGYLKRWGRPGTFYVDRDSIYTTTKQAAISPEFRAQLPMTQFTRAMSQLGIEVLTANSPQAKGRVERGFLTHQERLVNELRLRGISTIEDANHFLAAYVDEHNERYSVVPAEAGDAHKPLLVDHRQLDEILSLQIPRSVRSDFTVRHENQFFQLRKGQSVRVRPGDQVCVQTKLDGSLHILLRGSRLAFERLPGPPEKVAAPPRLRPRPVRPKPKRPFKTTFRFGQSGRPFNRLNHNFLDQIR